MPKPKQTMKPVKLPLAKKKSSRTFLHRYKIGMKRNFKGMSLSAFYLRYHSVEEFDLLHAEQDDDEARSAVMETVEDVVMGTKEVGYKEVYDEEDDDEDELEAFSASTRRKNKAKKLTKTDVELGFKSKRSGRAVRITSCAVVSS
jgi:hypothetical protein